MVLQERDVEKLESAALVCGHGLQGWAVVGGLARWVLNYGAEGEERVVGQR